MCRCALLVAALVAAFGVGNADAWSRDKQLHDLAILQQDENATFVKCLTRAACSKSEQRMSLFATAFIDRLGSRIDDGYCGVKNKVSDDFLDAYAASILSGVKSAKAPFTLAKKRRALAAHRRVFATMVRVVENC